MAGQKHVLLAAHSLAKVEWEAAERRDLPQDLVEKHSLAERVANDVNDRQRGNCTDWIATFDCMISPSFTSHNSTHIFLFYSCV